MSLLLDTTDPLFLGLFESYRKQTIRDLFGLATTPLSPIVARTFGALISMLRHLFRTCPNQILDILTHPTLSVLIHYATNETRHPNSPHANIEPIVTQLCSQLLCQLSFAGLLPPTGIYFPLLVDQLFCPGANITIICKPSSQTTRFDNQTILFDINDQPHPILFDWKKPPTELDQAVVVSPGYVHITPTLQLALVDNNPLWAYEAHPEKSGNALNLGNHTPKEWVDSLTEALAIIELTLPCLKTEIDHILRLVVPTGYDEQRHLSASYKEAVGIVYMTLHPRLLTMVEAIVHEFQHNKLNAVTYLDPLLNNAFEPLFPSPVRPDPRPLHGVLLAAHAFLPIAELYLQLIRQRHVLTMSGGFDERLRMIVAANTDACATLRAANPTKLGEELLTEMWEMNRRHHQQLAELSL